MNQITEMAKEYASTGAYKPRNKESKFNAAMRHFIAGFTAALSHNSGWVRETQKALDFAQAELRAMYKRQGVKSSNVLRYVDEVLSKIPAPPSVNQSQQNKER